MISPEIRISSPVSELWSTWLLLGLLLSMVIAEVLQPGTIRTSFRMVFSKMERTYGDSATSMVSTLCLNIYRIGIIAFVLYITLYTRPPFSIITFLKIIGILLIVLLIKQLITALVSYTFDLRRSYMLFRSQYSCLLTLICLLLFPLALCDLHWGHLMVMKWMLAPMALVLLAGLITKLFQDFYNGAKSLAYIVIYLVTAEIIPLVAAVWWVNHII